LSSHYSPKDEYEINPLDSELNIDWHFNLVGGTSPIISPKDAKAPSLTERLAAGQLPK
jgi:dTDP-4-dehydrorhamnose 3,5-epimerase